MKGQKQPWLGDPLQECIFILAPGLLPVVTVIVFNDYFKTHEVSTMWWIILVLCIDVSHVYSTLFRLYWDRQTFTKYRSVLLIIPGVAFAAGLALHYYDSMLFWRILAYIAVYHFVRQQYGFMRLYARKETPPRPSRYIDTIAIYTATVYPLLYWHINATDQLAWFIKGDFIRLDLHPYENLLTYMYVSVILLYVIKEIKFSISQRMINLPKNLIVLGTFASWYVGIVAFQGDLIFTLLNVVAHGIPYMALIWIHGKKRSSGNFSFNYKGVGIFVAALLLLAYFEESLWDAMVWNDHPDVFPMISGIVPLQNPLGISVVVSLLVLPQVTHYILDGFIWRFSRDREAEIS